MIPILCSWHELERGAGKLEMWAAETRNAASSDGKSKAEPCIAKKDEREEA